MSSCCSPLGTTGGGGPAPPASITPLSAVFFVDSLANPVGANGSIANPFPSIAAGITAVDAVGTGTLMVVPGNYGVAPLAAAAGVELAIVAMAQPENQIIPPIVCAVGSDLSLENVSALLSGGGLVRAVDCNIRTPAVVTTLVLDAHGGSVGGTYQSARVRDLALDSLKIVPVEPDDTLEIYDCTFISAELDGPDFEGPVVFGDGGSFSRALDAHSTFDTTPIVQGGVELAGILGDANALLDPSLGSRWVVLGALTNDRIYTLQIPLDETIPTTQIVENHSTGDDAIVLNGGASGGSRVVPGGFGYVFTWVDPDWLLASCFEWS